MNSLFAPADAPELTNDADRLLGWMEDIAGEPERAACLLNAASTAVEAIADGIVDDEGQFLDLLLELEGWGLIGWQEARRDQ